MKRAIYFLLIFFLNAIILAQHITICKAYTETGQPIDIIYTKNISTNQTICILLNAGNQKISGSTIFLFIDRNSDGTKQNQFNKYYSVEKGKNWLATSFKFSKEGIYEIYFTDANKNRLAAAALSVGRRQQIEIELPAASNKYLNPEIIFCERVQANYPINIKRNISIKTDGGIVYIFLKNDKPFDCQRIRAAFLRKSNFNTDYNEIIASKRFQIESDWTNAYFKYEFEKSGEYKISIFDENELLIKTAYITVAN